MCETREWEGMQTCQINDTNSSETLERRGSADVVVGRDSYPLCTIEKAYVRIGITGVVLYFLTLHPRYMPCCSTEHCETSLTDLYQRHRSDSDPNMDLQMVSWLYDESWNVSVI